MTYLGSHLYLSADTYLGASAPAAPNLSSPFAVRISRQPGHDSTQMDLDPSEPYLAYQLRAVPSASSPVTDGVLVESGGPGGDVIVTLTVTDDELVAAGLDGEVLLKAFTQGYGGEWSA